MCWLCVQVMGHHNAHLDPLDISCVNFDDAPVNSGFQDVGENVGTDPTETSLTLLFPPTHLPSSSPLLPLSCSLLFYLISSLFELNPFSVHILKSPRIILLSSARLCLLSIPLISSFPSSPGGLSAVVTPVDPRAPCGPVGPTRHLGR